MVPFLGIYNIVRSIFIENQLSIHYSMTTVVVILGLAKGSKGQFALLKEVFSFIVVAVSII